MQEIVDPSLKALDRGAAEFQKKLDVAALGAMYDGLANFVFHRYEYDTDLYRSAATHLAKGFDKQISHQFPGAARLKIDPGLEIDLRGGHRHDKHGHISMYDLYALKVKAAGEKPIERGSYNEIVDAYRTHSFLKRISKDVNLLESQNPNGARLLDQHISLWLREDGSRLFPHADYLKVGHGEGRPRWHTTHYSRDRQNKQTFYLEDVVARVIHKAHTYGMKLDSFALPITKSSQFDKHILAAKSRSVELARLASKANTEDIQKSIQYRQRKLSKTTDRNQRWALEEELAILRKKSKKD